MRGGAPDKFNLWTNGDYKLIHHDYCNLVNYKDHINDLISMISSEEYILPADEGDIEFANELAEKYPNIDQTKILLPRDGSKIINYNKFVPKDSIIYKKVNYYKNLKYEQAKIYSLEEFKNICNKLDPNYRAAYKTTTGSGSRGVLLVDPDRLYLGGKYISKLTKPDLDKLISFAEEENKTHECKIMIQDLIPNEPDLLKINVDFIIKDKKLLGYKWDETDHKAVFTNWDIGWFIKSDYTDKIMNDIANLLIKDSNITDAIMNFEAFSDMKSKFYLVEFNWRYSNSMFEGQALHMDFIGNYLNNSTFEVPNGRHKFHRYWQCKLESDQSNFKIGI